MAITCLRQPLIPRHRYDQACMWPGLVERWPVAIPSTVAFSDLEIIADARDRERRKETPCPG